MDTLQLLKNINSDKTSKKYFIGVFPRDLLPTKINYPSSFIVNTDNSNKRGEHWLAIYVDGHRKLDFFDPMGLPPVFYGLDGYINNIADSYQFNKMQFQNIFSDYCGFYCLLFIFIKSRNKNFNFKLFTKNFKKNDQIISKLIKEKFFFL